MQKALTIGLVLFILLSGISVNTVEGQVLLEITKKAEPGALIQGEQLTITVKVENKGVREFFNVKVTDTIPQGFELISGTTSMDRDSLKPGEYITLEYILKAVKAGDFILGSATVTYEGRLGVHYSKTSNTVEVHVLEPAKGSLLEYFPSSDIEIEEGTEIEVVCKVWNSGGSWCAIEARVFDAKTGETLAANWENCDAGDRNCVVIARKGINVHQQLRLGFQASHWDYEHAGWIRDETKYVTIKLRSKPEPTIKGNVYNTETGSPVEGATVTCFEDIACPYPPPYPTPKPPITVVTDSDGYFEFTGLEINPTGFVGGCTYSYKIAVTHRDYKTANETVKLTDTEPQAYLRFELQPTIKPNFKVTNLIVSPSEVKVRDTVTIIVDVKNIGEVMGTHTLKIRVNNVVVHSEEVTLSPEETKSIKCYYTPQSEGNYEVEADGLRREFNAVSPEITPTPPGEPELSISQTSLKEEPEVGEEVLIAVAILNKGKATAKNIHIEEHIPSSIAVSYVEGAEKAGGLVYWNGELDPGEAHSITHTLRILEEKSRVIPVTVTYEDASGNKKQQSTEIYLTAEIETTPSPLSNTPRLYIIILVAVVLMGLAIIIAVWRRGGEGGAEVIIEENK